MRNFIPVILFVCFVSGCGGSNTPTGGEESAANGTETPEDQPMDIRDSMEGRWVFDVVREMSAIPVALVEVVKNGDEWEIKAPTVPVVSDAPEFKDGKATADTIDLSFELGPIDMVYSGRLQNGIVRGSIVFDGGTVGLGLLTPSDLQNLGEPQPKPLRHFTDFQTIGIADDPTDELEKFVEEYPESALALDGFQRWLQFAKQNEIGSEELGTIIAGFRQSAAIWGKPREQMVPLDVAIRLSSQGYEPELAATFLQEFRDSLTEQQQQKEQLTGVLETVSASIQFAQNLQDLTSGNSETEATAVERLDRSLEENPLNGRAIHALANYYRDKSDLDNAIRHYSTLIAVPTLERTMVDEIMARDPSASLPSQQLTELWEKHHGNLSGLDGYLTQVYRETIDAFARIEDKHAVRGADENNKVALVELLTGSQCPPCVAADLTLDVLGKSYETSELIVVRYHQHIPGPDPLSNHDSNRRFSYYNAKGTPSVFLNGNLVGGVAGALNQFTSMMPAMTELIDKAIAEKVEVKFDIKATNDGENVSISASVNNVDDSDGGEYYLRLVLTEDDIVYKAPNGIRIHDMVARAMPGGDKGLLVENGKAEFSGDVSIAALKEAVNNELDMIEQFQNSRMRNRPLDFANLRLVAIVQDDVDRRIIQSHVIDVSVVEPTADNAKDEPVKNGEETANASEKQP